MYTKKDLKFHYPSGVYDSGSVPEAVSYRQQDLESNEIVYGYEYQKGRFVVLNERTSPYTSGVHPVGGYPELCGHKTG